MRRATLTLAALLVAGCSSASAPAPVPSTHAAPASPNAAPSPPPGPGTFVAIARKTGLGNKDIAHATDQQILQLGRILCEGMDEGAGYQDEISDIRKNAHKITVRQATIWIDAAARNLCPAHVSEIPSGAP